MKIVTGGRGCGATSQAVLTSASTDYPILSYKISSTFYQDRAEELGVEIPNPISIKDLEGSNVNNIIIDDAGMLLSSLLREKGFKGSIDMATFTF